jgi:hypothetical protein
LGIIPNGAKSSRLWGQLPFLVIVKGCDIMLLLLLQNGSRGIAMADPMCARRREWGSSVAIGDNGNS